MSSQKVMNGRWFIWTDWKHFAACRQISGTKHRKKTVFPEMCSGSVLWTLVQSSDYLWPLGVRHRRFYAGR